MKAGFFLVVSLLILTSMASLMAQRMKDNPESKNWDSLIGKWSGEFKARGSPNSDCKQISRKYQIEWILDGAFLQIRGLDSVEASSLKRLVPWSISSLASLFRDSDKVSFINIWGYDTHLATHVGQGFRSNSLRLDLDSGGWSGRTWRENWTLCLPEGKLILGNCSYDYSSDFTSAAVECQEFTDGMWWTAYKGKATKVK
jgi:hypothetical protein